MSRRNAAVAGALAWLVLLLLGPRDGVRGLVVWGLVCAVVVTVSVVVARVLSRELKKAVLKDER